MPKCHHAQIVEASAKLPSDVTNNDKSLWTNVSNLKVVQKWKEFKEIGI
jgi:hypothetical protein